MGYAAIVVGSGPAGVSCAKSLLKNGNSVLLLDVGIDLDPSTRDRIKSLVHKPRQEWKAADVDFLKSSSTPTSSGLPLKTAFGSDYAYSGTEKDIPLAAHHVDVKPSFAQGGFSAVWGAAMLPFSEEDMEGWPISSKDLAPHYRAVLDWMPLAGQRDALETRWPVYTDRVQNLRRSRQALSLLDHLTSHERQLQTEGIQFGQSRLAVHAEKSAKNSMCVYCGLCLYGCPYACIYETRETLEDLKNHPKFTYASDIVVKRLTETEGQVTVHAVDFKTRQERIFNSERIFLGAGVLSTTKILLESLEAYEEAIPMTTSQHFMLPLMLHETIPDVEREELHTLAQIFLEIHDSAISPKPIHLQIYTYNDLYLKTLKRMGIGHLLSLWPPLKRTVLGRLLIVQGYLHSADSAMIRLKLSRKIAGEESCLSIDAGPRRQTKLTLKRLAKKLYPLRKSLGFTPLTSFLRMSAVGYGHHNGGTFPMKASPSRFESDQWGRPRGFRRVHAIDASVFSSTPATTITLAIMANAHRIGSFRE
jgi:choline dehydrogenase-like flavoprotein